MCNKVDIHIGKKIGEVMLIKDVSVANLAMSLEISSSNLYKLLRNHNMDIKMLANISDALEYDFFKYMSESGVINK